MVKVNGEVATLCRTSRLVCDAMDIYRNLVRTALAIPTVSPGLGAEGAEGVVELDEVLKMIGFRIVLVDVECTWRHGRNSSPLAVTHL